MREATGRYCLLLNEDSELRPGAPAALVEALDADPGRRPRARSCSTPAASPVPCAWRFPGVGTALAGALFLHRRLTVQSGGAATRRVDWAQSSALLVRREAAAEVGYLDPDFFVYYDECDFCKRLADAGWRDPLRPGRRGDPPRPALDRPRRRPAADRRIPPQPRPLHAQAPLARRRPSRCALLTAWSYAVRALAATVLPGQPARVYRAHARQALLPGRGESIRDRGRRCAEVKQRGAVLVHAPRLVDLRHVARRPRPGVRARRAGARRSSPGRRRQREPAALLGGEEAAAEEGERVGGPERRRGRAGRRRRRSASPARRPRPGRAETSTTLARRPHS